MRHEDITEVSDPHQLTIDEPEHRLPEIRVLKGRPTDAEPRRHGDGALAAAVGGASEPGPQELNLWGHLVDKLRYPVTSWQRVTLLESGRISGDERRRPDDPCRSGSPSSARFACCAMPASIRSSWSPVSTRTLLVAGLGSADPGTIVTALAGQPMRSPAG